MEPEYALQLSGTTPELGVGKGGVESRTIGPGGLSTNKIIPDDAGDGHTPIPQPGPTEREGGDPGLVDAGRLAGHTPSAPRDDHRDNSIPEEADGHTPMPPAGPRHTGVAELLHRDAGALAGATPSSPDNTFEVHRGRDDGRRRGLAGTDQGQRPPLQMSQVHLSDDDGRSRGLMGADRDQRPPPSGA